MVCTDAANNNDPHVHRRDGIAAFAGHSTLQLQRNLEWCSKQSIGGGKTEKSVFAFWVSKSKRIHKTKVQRIKAPKIAGICGKYRIC